MIDRWSGLYLKERRDYVEQALRRLARGRGYELIMRKANVTYPIADDQEIKDIYERGVGKTIDISFLIQINPLWTRLIGFEQVDVVHPRLFFNSELIIMLGCDGFECGFSDPISWWYIYYENGELVDQFDSNPIKTIINPNYDQPLDPNDLRTIYFISESINEWQDAPLPPDILSTYQGDTSKLEPILIKDKLEVLDKILQETNPVNAISKFSTISRLPYIGQYLSIDLFTTLSNLLVNPDEDTLKLLQNKSSFLVFQHPKVKWFNQFSDD